MTAVHLTPRAMRVATLTARGLSNKEVGYQLNLSEGTVKLYLTRDVYKPLSSFGVTDRYTLMRWWIENVEQRGNCAACLVRLACLEGGNCAAE